MLASTAAASVWTWVWAWVPVSVPFRMASRSSRTCPTEACVGCAPDGVSLWRSFWSVCMAVWTADQPEEPLEVVLLVLDDDPVVDDDPVLDDELELDADWMADWTAWRSDWIWVTCVWVRPMLERMDASSDWIFDWALLPLSVPLRIAARSSWSWPTDACVGLAPLGVSFLRSVWRVWNTD